MVNIRVLAFEQSDQDVQLATELYLNKHTSFESFVKDLEKQPFMSKYNKSDESYYVMAKALGNICYLSQSQNISIEDFDSSLISFEDFTISNEGVSSTVVNKSLDLVNVSKPVYNKLDIMGQIKVHMRSIKKAFEKKDWKLVSSIRDLLTSLWNKAKAAGITIKDSVKDMTNFISRKLGFGKGKEKVVNEVKDVSKTPAKNVTTVTDDTKWVFPDEHYKNLASGINEELRKVLKDPVDGPVFNKLGKRMDEIANLLDNPKLSSSKEQALTKELNDLSGKWWKLWAKYNQ